ncbi:hypothetical protein D3C71_1905520 [compost metagenome]
MGFILSLSVFQAYLQIVDGLLCIRLLLLQIFRFLRDFSEAKQLFNKVGLVSLFGRSVRTHWHLEERFVHRREHDDTAKQIELHSQNTFNV